MTETTGATDRTRAVLDPAFVEGLGELSVEELRGRRDEALAEREFQSFLRRLLQGRVDLLRAERERRDSGAAQAPLVERLTAALTEGSRPSSSRGEAVRDVLSESDVEEATRRADEFVPSAAVGDPDTLSDDELEAVLVKVVEVEGDVSAARTAVLRVHDRLQGELTRRYREDHSSIPGDR